MSDGQKMQTQIGLVVGLIGILMFIIAIQMRNFGMFCLFSLVMGIGFAIAIYPWSSNRRRRQFQERQDLEDMAAIQRSRRRKELEKSMYEEE